MKSITFENREALFAFDQDDVYDCLVHYSNKHQIREATDLVNFLTSIKGDSKRVPQQEKEYFGYVVLDLLSLN
jgi:hypothetical protein